MIRSLYRCLLDLHPPAFRRRFADEMLSIFDQTDASPGRFHLMLDAFLSLVRQWTLRPEFSHEASPVESTRPASDGIPFFYTIHPFRPRSAAVINGLVVSFAVFCITCFAIRYSWIRVLHIRIPEVQLDRSTWTPPRHPDGAAASRENLMPPPQPANAPVKSAAPPRAELDLPQVPPPLPIQRRRPARPLAQTNPAKQQDNPSPNQEVETSADLPPLDVYRGTYIVEGPSRLTIVISSEDQNLAARLQNQPKLALAPVSQTKFVVKGNENCWIEFMPSNESEAVTRQLEFSCNGQHYLAHRQ